MGSALNIDSETKTKTTTNMTTYNIVSRHSKLSDAVAAASLDLSYNEPLAKADLARDDRDPAFTTSYVLERDGELSVWSEYRCDINLFNRYTPFHSSLHDGLFSMVLIEDATVQITRPMIRRTSESRKVIAKCGVLVAA